MAAGLSSELGLSWAPPSQEQVATICRLLCSSSQLAPGRAQVAEDLGLHPLGVPSDHTLGGQFQTMWKHHPSNLTSDTLKGQSQQAAESAGTRAPLK